MHISARQLADWASTPQARSELPRIIRRLSASAGSVTALSMPAGASVQAPGWDGELLSTEGDPWVPCGRSFWELSCEGSSAGAITRKANRDYSKRMEETPASVRQNSTFIFVTARHWSTKAKWVTEQRQQGLWADVRGYDADDLEAWLEHRPAVSLYLASQLGLAGPGVAPLERFWSGWADQCAPAISRPALLDHREATKGLLLQTITSELAKPSPVSPIPIWADSAGEGAAFACASLLDDLPLSREAVVVTSEEGWRFVETNETIKIAIATRPEFCEAPPQRRGLVIVVPHASGESLNARQVDDSPDAPSRIKLDRVEHHQFRDTLIAMGVENSDAEKLANSTSRSWSIYRRLRATNTAITQPKWPLRAPTALLPALSLIDGWVAGNLTDEAIVSDITGLDIETIERELAGIARWDDAPIMRIGKVWKVRSRLELLLLYGPQLTRGQLERYFTQAAELLSDLDPTLELPADKRHAAQIYGKTRPESPLLRRSLLGALPMLAVRGRELEPLASLDVEGRVQRVVRDALIDASPEQWLSRTSDLRSLAEAAPDAFLDAVLSDLRRPGPAIKAFFSESDSDPLWGRRWHVDLLWALELLAWAPQRLERVCDALCQLSSFKLPDNLSNRPFNSLISVFRSWMPQTAATLEQRLKVLDRLIAKHPDLGYELINKLLYTGHDYATPSSRPVWREEDAGAGRGVSPKERNDALCAFADREVSMAHGVPERLAALLDKIDNLSDRWADPILAAIRDIGSEKPGDDALALLRDAIRKKLHRLLNYRDESDAGASILIEQLQELYALTEPDDLSWRHAWLFENSWVDLPAFKRLEDYKAEDALRTEHRKQALQEILDHSGLAGLLTLAAHKTDAYLIGCTLGQLDAAPPLDEVVTFLVSRQNGYLRQDPIGQLTSGYLNHILKSGEAEPLERVLLLAREAGHDADRLGRLLSCAPQRAFVWDFLESQPADVQASYWRSATPYFLQDAGSDRAETIINCLLDAKRPYTALNALKGQFDTVSADTLARILEAIAQSQDDEERWPLDSYSVTEAIKAIENGDGVAEHRIVQLEFLFSEP